MRYGMTPPGGAGPQAVWGLASTDEMRPLGLAVLIADAIALIWLVIRVRPLNAGKYPATPAGTPGIVPVRGHAWLTCGPCHQPHHPVQLCWTGPTVIPTTPQCCRRAERWKTLAQLLVDRL